MSFPVALSSPRRGQVEAVVGPLLRTAQHIVAAARAGFDRRREQRRDVGLGRGGGGLGRHDMARGRLEHLALAAGGKR
jgi:hypothetical protein